MSSNLARLRLWFNIGKSGSTTAESSSDIFKSSNALVTSSPLYYTALSQSIKNFSPEHLDTFIKRGGILLDNGKLAIKEGTNLTQLDDLNIAIKNLDDIDNIKQLDAINENLQKSILQKNTIKATDDIPMKSLTRSSNNIAETATTPISRTRQILRNAGKFIIPTITAGIAGLTGYQIGALDQKIKDNEDKMKKDSITSSISSTREYSITNIEVTDDSVVNITYEPSENICKGDVVTIYNNNTNISNNINKTFLIQKVIAKGIISIILLNMSKNIYTKNEFGDNLGKIKFNISDDCKSKLQSNNLDLPEMYIPTDEDIFIQEENAILEKQEKIQQQNDFILAIGITILVIFIMYVLFNLLFT